MYICLDINGILDYRILCTVAIINDRLALTEIYIDLSSQYELFSYIFQFPDPLCAIISI